MQVDSGDAEQERRDVYRLKKKKKNPVLLLYPFLVTFNTQGFVHK